MENKIDTEYIIQTNVDQYKTKTTGKTLIERILNNIDKQKNN